MKTSAPLLLKLTLSAPLLALAAVLHTQAQNADPSGLWKWTTPSRDGTERHFNLELKADGGKLTGKLITPNRTNETFSEIEISDGVVHGANLSFNIARGGRPSGNPFVTKYTGEIVGNEIVGKIESPGRAGNPPTATDWKAERNTTGKLVSGPIVQIKPGYNAQGYKIVNETKYRELSVADAEKYLAEYRDAIVLDLRPPAAYAAGHLPNARNLDVTDDEHYREVLKPLDKTKRYVVHSVTGHYRTVRALEYFEANGFENVVAIDGGYQAWVSAGKPIEK